MIIISFSSYLSQYFWEAIQIEIVINVDRQRPSSSFNGTGYRKAKYGKLIPSPKHKWSELNFRPDLMFYSFATNIIIRNANSLSESKFMLKRIRI